MLLEITNRTKIYHPSVFACKREHQRPETTDFKGQQRQWTGHKALGQWRHAMVFVHDHLTSRKHRRDSIDSPANTCSAQGMLWVH